MTFGVPALAAGFASKFDEIGPYIGFGSLVAVVAMAVLVFAQGRELQRLREWAGTSPERLDALEQEVRDGQAARLAQPAPRPGFATAAGVTPAAAAPGAPPRPPGAPGAPAVPGAPGAAPAAPGAPGAPAVPGAAGAPVVGAGAATPGVPTPPGAARPTPPRPTPPGAAPPTRVIPSASTAGGPRAATAAGAAAATARERDRSGDAPQRSIGQIIGVAAVGLVVLLALLFAFGVIGGSDEGPGTSTEAGPSATSSTATQPAAPRYQRADMTTIVLNASGSGGLAKDVSDSIEERFRFPMGEAANFTIGGANQSAATTTVQYRTGGDESVSQNRAAAQDIARFLKLRVTNTVVRRMTTDVRASAPSQKVVVIVGADYARANPPAGAPGTNGTTSTPDGGTATPATPGTTGGTSTTTPQSTSTSQLQTPDTTDLGTGGAVDGTDGTGGTTVP